MPGEFLTMGSSLYSRWGSVSGFGRSAPMDTESIRRSSSIKDYRLNLQSAKEQRVLFLYGHGKNELVAGSSPPMTANKTLSPHM